MSAQEEIIAKDIRARFDLLSSDEAAKLAIELYYKYKPKMNVTASGRLFGEVD